MSLCQALIDIESSIRTRIGYPPLAGATKGNSMNTGIYKQGQLQEHFKVGERAIVRETYYPSHSDYISQVGVIDIFNEDHDPWLTMRNGRHVCATQLEKVEKTLETLEVGDVVDTHSSVGDKTVMGVCGKLFFLSVTGLPDALGAAWTVARMQEKGFTVKGAETEETIMTVKEIEDKLKITNLRIKKESK